MSVSWTWSWVYSGEVCELKRSSRLIKNLGSISSLSPVMSCWAGYKLGARSSNNLATRTTELMAGTRHRRVAKTQHRKLARFRTIKIYIVITSILIRAYIPPMGTTTATGPTMSFTPQQCRLGIWSGLCTNGGGGALISASAGSSATPQSFPAFPLDKKWRATLEYYSKYVTDGKRLLVGGNSMTRPLHSSHIS